jgi:hypothetical protein
MKFFTVQNIHDMVGGGGRGGREHKSPLLLSHTGSHSQVVLTQKMGSYFEFCQGRVSVLYFNSCRYPQNNIFYFSIYFEANETKYAP